MRSSRSIRMGPAHRLTRPPDYGGALCQTPFAGTSRGGSSVLQPRYKGDGPRPVVAMILPPKRRATASHQVGVPSPWRSWRWATLSHEFYGVMWLQDGRWDAKKPADSHVRYLSFLDVPINRDGRAAHDLSELRHRHERHDFGCVPHQIYWRFVRRHTDRPLVAHYGILRNPP